MGGGDSGMSGGLQMNELPNYEVFALRYATNANLKRADSLIFHKAEDHETPAPMDFFIWVIRDGARAIVVDTGFSAAAGEKRNRRHLHSPVELIRTIGVDPETLKDVILTHLDYDHSGNIDCFPNAMLHIQDAEMAYVTGRNMRHKHLRAAVMVDDVVAAVRAVHEGRVVFHNGDAEIAPGVTAHHVGGHTAGLQVVRVHTQRGWVVLASDASHYYRNIRHRRPHPVVLNVADMLAGYERCEWLADGPDHIIAGHDPLVLECFPHDERMQDVVKLHQAPIKPIAL
jgi:glyoxylase-like metal-dependent hydrolase (beta-lactamase superfamily II)